MSAPQSCTQPPVGLAFQSKFARILAFQRQASAVKKAPTRPEPVSASDTARAKQTCTLWQFDTRRAFKGEGRAGLVSWRHREEPESRTQFDRWAEPRRSENRREEKRRVESGEGPHGGCRRAAAPARSLESQDSLVSPAVSFARPGCFFFQLAWRDWAESRVGPIAPARPWPSSPTSCSLGGGDGAPQIAAAHKLFGAVV